ncbi:NAD(P)/FAD-dependent oxidoreductase [Catellatospora bangladeshensis]|uniref:Sarcosine oxidase subunit beta n=1 Tax=Catellatospora bangladeshensis TaxID=310355 RepID=A0A8J3JLY3_9ACTN|nr:FAD-dependent oxidoreductase [Catellatospora bangladeshensis]GIF84914.1 sarcosine oxidase subunit beta [Catellatospora bangladeshensis]
MAHYDTAVVGGGLLGCAVAWHLARAGTRVLLVEKDQLNRHASGQNAGSLHFQLEYRMVEHGDDAAREAARALPLHLDAMRAWAGLEAALGEPCGVAQRGGLMLAETPAEVAALDRKAALEREHGLDVDVLEGARLRDLAPYLAESVRAAAHLPGEGKANPRLVTPAFARAATRHGAELRTGHRVTALHRDGGRWHLHAEGRADTADTVVLAAGVWTTELAAMADTRLPVFPVGLTMSATARTAPLLPHLIQHVGRRLSMKQTPEGNILLGGGWPAKLVTRQGRIDLDHNPELRYESLTGNADAARVVPAVMHLPVIRSWSGMTTLTPDQLPLLGAVPRRPGLYVATGGSAFTLGPTYARLLAATLLGAQPDLPLDGYSPARFGALNFV